MISSHGLAFQALRSQRRPGVPFPPRQKGGIVAFFAGMEGVGVTQMNLIWQLSFFHKIDLRVRFPLPRVRIRGHEED
jgi:hypothetical protein